MSVAADLEDSGDHELGAEIRDRRSLNGVLRRTILTLIESARLSDLEEGQS